MIFLLAILSLQLGFMYRLERDTGNITAMVWPLIWVFLVLPLILERLPYFNNGEYSDATVLHLLSFAVSANFGYIVVIYTTNLILNSFSRPPNTAIESAWGTINMTPIYAGSIILIFVLSGVNLSRIAASDLSDKRGIGLASLALVWVYCLLAGSLIQNLRDRKYFWVLVGITTALLMLTYFRSRSLLAVIVIAWAADYLIRRRGKAVLVAAIGVAALILGFMVKAVRYMGALNNITDVENLIWNFEYIFQNAFISGDLSIHKYALYLFEHCEAKSYCFNSTILSEIFGRFGLAERPEATIEYLMYDDYFEAWQNGSLHPTIYGVSYGDNGFFWGVVAFSLLGVYHSVLSRLCAGDRFYIFSGFFAYYIMFLSRGSFYNGLVTSAVGMVLGLAIYWCLKLGGKFGKNLPGSPSSGRERL